MRVMAFGTFDNFHPGHNSYLAQAGCFGDELFVIVARDENVLKIKGHLPQENETIRRQKVSAALKNAGYPGKAVLGGLASRWLVLKKYQPDVICLGYDQQVDLKQLKDELVKSRLFCKIKRLRAHYPEKYKSRYCLAQNINKANFK